MLNFPEGPNEKEPFNSTTRLRHSSGFGELVLRASAALGIDKSAFIRAAAEKEAERVLAAQATHVMTPEDAAAFEAALDAAPEPTPAAKAAARAYRVRVVHAD